jgi:hypothetical protein
MWIISVQGTLDGNAIHVGDSLIAVIDTPGQTPANWNPLEGGIAYVPEDVANKVTSISGASIDTQYPSAKLLYDKLELIRIPTVTVVVDTYSILSTDETVVCNKATSFTVVLPTAVVGQVFRIKNINTGIVTIDGKTTDTIDGELSQDILQWECIHVQCYAANKWAII